MEWAWEALTSPHCIHGNLFFFEFFPFPHKTKKFYFPFPSFPKKHPTKAHFQPTTGKNKIKKIKKVFFFSKKIHFLCFFEFCILKSLPKISILGDFFYLQKKSISSLPYFSTLSSPRILFEKFSIRVRETMLSKLGSKIFFRTGKIKKKFEAGT